MEKRQAFSNGSTDAHPPPYSTTANGQNQASELSKLWSEAIQTYEKKTKKTLRLDQMSNLDEVIKGTERETNGFSKFRHDKGKTDKVRSAFKDNLGWIQKVVKVAEVVGKAAGAFPPAMPAGLIFCAFGQLMNSFNNMSADYDKILDFFEFVHRFFERLSIIEERTPDSPGLLKAVVYVFSNMLEIFAIAQQYSKEQGRFKKWFKNLTDGEDPDLKNASGNMEKAVNELSDAVGMESLKMTAFIAEVIHNTEKDVKVVVSTLTRIDKTTHITRAYTEKMIESNESLLTKFDQMFELVAAKEGSKPQPRKGNTEIGKIDPGEKKRLALNRVKGHFDKYSPGFDFSAGTRGRRNENNQTEAPINGTGQWLLEDEDYKFWLSKEINNLAWIQGDAGIGKSFLSETIVTNLKRSSTYSNCYASFFFRETQDGLSSFENALCYLSFQIAEKNLNYLEGLASALDATTSSSDEFDPWKTCFAERFPAKGDAHIWIVLDGIDEMDERERKQMIECLAKISEGSLNIHVLVTGRPNVLDEVETLDPLIIKITKEKMESDIQQFILRKIEVLPHLSKFRKFFKKAITKKLTKKADGMLYVEHMLRRLNYIGREKAVMKDLDKILPDCDKLEGLYDIMLEDCQASITTEHCQVAKELFAWISYSKRTLTHEEAAKICALASSKTSFDVEDLVDEINGRSAKLLEFKRGQDDEEDEEVDGKEDGNNQMSAAEAVDWPGFRPESEQTPLAFQERSLREYFRAVGAEENGLRTPLSTAHLAIFKTCGSLLLSVDHELDDGKQPKLLEYAAKYFSNHLIEIDINSVSDDEAQNVVVILYKILTNFNNFARVMEHFGVPYSKMASNENGNLIDTIKKWAARFTSMNENQVDVKVAQWAKEIKASEKPLMVLARGHVLNLFRAYDGYWIVKAFMFAKDIFHLGVLEFVERAKHPFTLASSIFLKILFENLFL